MNSKEMHAKLVNIYIVLVELGGAYGPQIGSFVEYHKGDDRYKEWRFSGHLGYGGKYYAESNTVSCYKEDETPERIELIKKINLELKKIVSN